MPYSEFFREILEHPVIKTLLAAAMGLFSTPAVLIVVVPLMWTLDFVSGMYALYKRTDVTPFSKLKMNKCYEKMSVHIMFLIGITILANLFRAEFIQFWGFGFIVTTEFISVVRNLYGHKQASKIFRDLWGKAGLDINDGHFGEEDEKGEA